MAAYHGARTLSRQVTVYSAPSGGTSRGNIPANTSVQRVETYNNTYHVVQYTTPMTGYSLATEFDVSYSTNRSATDLFSANTLSKSANQSNQNFYVTNLQCFLRRVPGGTSSLNPDGYFGSATDTAVRNFQAYHKLTVDGLVGAGTKAKLASLI